MQLSVLLAELREQLSAAGAATESLVVRHPPRKLGPITRPERLERAGECWRLGVLLLTQDARLAAVGQVLRTTPERHIGTTSELARQREQLREAARRARIPAGVTLNIDARWLDPDAPTAPLIVHDGILHVEWSRGLTTALEPYLRERAELLIHPPERA